jgi:hypothetical protein
MNPNTGHLIAVDDERQLPSGYEGLHGSLARDARRKLERAATERSQSSSYVNLRSTTPLANWAKKKRLAKIAAKSRRNNRGK